jgi:hypothetical protein
MVAPVPTIGFEAAELLTVEAGIPDLEEGLAEIEKGMALLADDGFTLVEEALLAGREGGGGRGQRTEVGGR